jgi:HAD superfamily hydrolase (TIGR01662 family)
LIQAVFFDKTYTIIKQDPEKMKEVDQVVQKFLEKNDIYVPLSQIASLREKSQSLFRMGKIKSWNEITEKMFDEFGIDPPPFIERVYRETHLAMGKLYPHAKEVLEGIKKRHLKIGLITESDTDKVELELVRENIKELFDVVVVSDQVGENKPSVKLFQAALKKLNVKPENSVYIGDRLFYDILPAKQLGFKTVWIRQGAHSEEGLSQLDDIRPDFIIEDIGEVLKIIRQLIEQDKNDKNESEINHSRQR